MKSFTVRREFCTFSKTNYSYFFVIVVDKGDPAFRDKDKYVWLDFDEK